MPIRVRKLIGTVGLLSLVNRVQISVLRPKKSNIFVQKLACQLPSELLWADAGQIKIGPPS
jgi:hypothetical protein